MLRFICFDKNNFDIPELMADQISIGVCSFAKFDGWTQEWKFNQILKKISVQNKFSRHAHRAHGKRK